MLRPAPSSLAHTNNIVRLGKTLLLMDAIYRTKFQRGRLRKACALIMKAYSSGDVPEAR